LKIQAGKGNSLILNNLNEVYGFGDNEYNKITESEEKFITKQPRLISFTQKNTNNKKVAIYKIFAGYDHCFAISESGEIYGWGNARLNRLTECLANDEDYKVQKYPKPITIKWNSIKDEVEEKYEVNENGEQIIKPVTMLDEIGVLKILNKNFLITNFKEFLVITPIKYYFNSL